MNPDQLMQAASSGDTFSSFTMGNIMVGLIAGILGMWYLASGKKEGSPSLIIAGLLLCITPYFISNEWLNGGVCALVALAPFAWRRYSGDY